MHLEDKHLRANIHKLNSENYLWSVQLRFKVILLIK